MIAYIVRRLLGLVLVLFGICVITFVLSRVLPADPARGAIGKAGAEHYAAMREQMGLDQPLPEQFRRYLSDLLHGDLGYSYASRRSVAADLADYFPATLELTLGAMLIAGVIGVPLGIVAAARAGGALDRLIGWLAVAGVALPLFVAGLLLQVLFYKGLGWFPAAGRIAVQLGAPAPITGLFTLDSLVTGDWPRLGSTLQHLALPSFTLALPLIAMLTRLVRTAMLQALGRDYVRTARGKGLAERRVIYRHAFRNALLPTVTSLGMIFGSLLGGAFIIEVIFNYPGIGKYMLTSILRAESAPVVSTTLLVAAVYMLANLLVDIAYVYIDPRIRYG